MAEPESAPDVSRGPVARLSPGIGRWREVVAVTALALAITMVMAAPVLRAPTERIFGKEIVGRNHDPFTVMEQFGRPFSLGVYSQPVTDLAGKLLARFAGPVAAYNVIILLSFPLAAAFAYLLARHLALSPAGASVAALAYAFSPFHIAHAAYHPHIAQVQWIPLYLLALWRCLENSTPGAVVLLAISTAAVTLSNFYGGVIAAVITPVAILGHQMVRYRQRPGWMRHLLVTSSALLVMAAAGLVYLRVAAPAVLADPSSFAFRRAELFHFSAKWWSYLVPPLGHPILAGGAKEVWKTAGVGGAVLEQQVYLGWGILALGAFAGFRWLARDRKPAGMFCIPIIFLMALAALLFSLSPERRIGPYTILRPSGMLHSILPMFRSYARFGVVVQLMAALAAGVGVDRLLRSGSRPARVACFALLLFAGAEYLVWPPDLWRDVLPTAAHRFIAGQPGRARVLDCVKPSAGEASVPWLTGYRVSFPGGELADCAEPGFPGKLAASGYTHLIVRPSTRTGQWFRGREVPEGLRSLGDFEDSRLFAVTALPPAVRTTTMTGFRRREHGAARTWRWMGDEASWRITNGSGTTLSAVLEIELSAFGGPRRLELFLDGTKVLEEVVGLQPGLYRTNPFEMGPGGHELLFHPSGLPEPSGDAAGKGSEPRQSFAVFDWRWIAPGARQ